MGKNIINIALFGLGRIGQMHANNLINHKDFNLKYIFDKDQKLTKRLSKKYNSIGIQNPKIAFKDKNIKCIFIASSTNTHLKFIEEAVVNRKVVFCEKPLDLDLNKINKCKKRTLRFTVDNGLVNFKVLEKHDDKLLCRVIDGGKIGSKRSVNLPGVRIDLPSIPKKIRRI